ncbi:MAG: translation elongation factor Ts [Amoebophilaceae bacterium]|nr:translation elongation factor Ts [Amoebophilaceae bacterium]
MAISAQDIAFLRKKTGAGMMDCKKSLVEAEGDFEKAIDLLRKKGQKISVERNIRDASEGVVFTFVNENHTEAFLLVLNCETDFVAKNSLFCDLGKSIFEVAIAHNPVSVEALQQLPLGDGTVEAAILSSMSAIGEKIAISAYETLKDEVVVAYTHAGSKLGVLVGLKGATGENVWHAGRDIAMQIAAMHPLAVDKDQVDPSVVERELVIIKEQVIQEGYPEDKIEKIIQGRLNKFFQENTLLDQPFIKNNKLSVLQYLKGVATDLTITSFKRVSVH